MRKSNAVCSNGFINCVGSQSIYNYLISIFYALYCNKVFEDHY